MTGEGIASERKRAQGGHDGASRGEPAWPSPIVPIAIGIGVGLGYFLAARLSLFLLTPNDGLAVFWPAAGIALGVLLAFGPRARLLVTAGVMAATIVANLKGDRDLAIAFVFALANAGEALFAAWLIRRTIGSEFSFEGVSHVLCFFAATAVACAASGIVATLGILLLHGQTAPALTIWLNWSASDALGAIAVAPLIICVVRAVQNRPKPTEALEATLALVALAAVSIVTLSTSANYWFTIAPVDLILPLLLWLAARSRPLFTAIGVFVVALVIVWTTTFGIGLLGDASLTDTDRVHAARAALLIVSLFGFTLAALFAERRRIEAALAESKERLRLAVEGAELGVWNLDLASRRFENDLRDRQIHGHDVEAPPATLAEARSFVHPEDLALIDNRFRASARERNNYKVNYRLASTGSSRRERWVALEGTVQRDGSGRPLRVLGVTRDITERKELEDALQRNERKFREVLEALPAAIYVTDAAGYITYCNQAAVDLWGTKPRFGEDKWSDLVRYYDRDGKPMPIGDCPTEIALKQGRPMRSLEAIIERRDGTRIPILPCPTPLYDPTGDLAGVVNMTLDISERKNAELALAERNMQLDLAGKVALVGTFAFDVTSGRMTISPGYAAIHGMPEQSDDHRDEWRARVHPDDLPRLVARFDQTLAEERHDHFCNYRIVRPDGEVRWIESRSYISYDEDGPRLVGANIDVTDRKLVEGALDERNMLLSLAGKAAGVGSYAYDAGSDLMQITAGYAALHGLPEGATETTRRGWRARVHPDDHARIQNTRSEAYREHRKEYAIEYRILRPGGEIRWIESRSFISYNSDNSPRRVIGINIDVTERRRAEDHQKMLIAELDHRVKNVLATVAAVAANTLESSRSTQQFASALDARIRALAATHEVLSTRQWRGLPLDELVRRQLAPYAAHNNASISGPPVLLRAEAGQAVSMVLHELVTNAAKYGALSTHKGRVTVHWRFSDIASARDSLIIDWQEADGPTVRSPRKTGYGTSVISDLVPYELRGKVKFELPQTGAHCRLEIPAKWTLSARQKVSNPDAASPAQAEDRDAQWMSGTAGSA